MKHTYCKVECKHPQIEKPMEYGWMLKVSSVEALMDYLMTDVRWKEGFSDVIKSKPFNPNGDHHRTRVGSSLSVLSEMTGDSLIDTLIKFSTDAQDAKFKLLKESGCIYIGEVGGFFPKGKGVKELKKVSYEGNPHKGFWALKDNEDILTSKARYMQWTNGSHWYAKIGNVDVRVDGHQKWGTKWEAQEAVKKFKETILKEKKCTKKI